MFIAVVCCVDTEGFTRGVLRSLRSRLPFFVFFDSYFDIYLIQNQHLRIYEKQKNELDAVSCVSCGYVYQIEE